MLKAAIFSILLTLGMTMTPLHAQINGDSFPRAVAVAHTVAIIDDTHQPGVAQGAADALKAWGRFTVVDDPDNADLTLRFDKAKEHSGRDTQSTDPKDNTPSYSYSMSFGSSVHMKAYLKDGTSPFYTTKSDDSKKKAGAACVSDFRSAVASHAH